MSQGTAFYHMGKSGCGKGMDMIKLWKGRQEVIYIIQNIYKFFLTLNSTIFLAFIYAVKSRLYIGRLGSYSIVLYLVGILLFTIMCLVGIVVLSDDSVEKIQDISLANDSYMPSYLGYFFVALSIPDKDWLTFGVVFVVIYIFTYFSHSLYFNPLFLLFGFNFYYVTSQSQMKIFIISRKKDIRGVENVKFDNLKRINEFTFIDKEK